MGAAAPEYMRDDAGGGGVIDPPRLGSAALVFANGPGLTAP